MAQVPSIVPIQGLEAWWSFSGNANDLSGNGNNFTNTGGATLTADRDGNANSAYNFNGVDQYLLVNSPSFSFAQTDSFTVSFWTQKTSNQYGIAVMQSSGASGNFIWLFQSSSTGVLNYGTNKQGSAWSWANSAYTLNQWEHFVGTYENGTMKVYKNGQFVTSATFGNTGSVQAALPLRVGRSHGGNYYAGKIDDLGIWSRVLSQAEITDLYVGCSVAVNMQPQNDSVSIGGTAQFGLTASTTGLNYQWQIDSNGTFQNLTNSAIFQGVTSNTLTVSNASFAMDGYTFRCAIGDGGSCSDTSDVVSLFVCGAISTQPLSVNTVINSTAKFSVASTDPNATFQWQVSTTTSFIDIANNSFYTGAQDDTLVLQSAAMIFNAKDYRCVVRSGVCSDTSQAASLTITNNVGLNEVEDTKLQIYPNPTKGLLQVEVIDDLINENYYIANSQGQIIKEGIFDSKTTALDLSHLPQGNYFFYVVGLIHYQLIQLH
tara:strand:- start:3774 stop:5237 length:1464 start_codon:yes stop_codon:yes gene_type:complete